MKTFSVYSIKGGVGKTTAAVTLAAQAAKAGVRTVVWDLDPQAAASFCLRVVPEIKGGGGKLIRGKTDILDCIKESDYEGLDLIPSDISYRKLDLNLSEAKKPGKQLAKVIAPLADKYDLLILDCPPGLSLLSDAVFDISDVLLVPVIPSPFSLSCLATLIAYLNDRKSTPRVLPFFSMVDKRRRSHRDVVAEFADSAEFLKTVIPICNEVEHVAIERKMLGEIAPKSTAATAFEKLWRELHAGLD